MTLMTWRESLQQPSEPEVRGQALDSELSQLLSFEEHGKVQFPPFCHRHLGLGVIQEDLKGVEIPENPNYDYPRTYRMSKKITEDKCSRAMGAECNDKIVALTRAGRGMTCLV